MKTLVDELGAFIEQVYIPDVCVIASRYPEWLKVGKTNLRLLSVPEMPMDPKGSAFAMPGGYIPMGDRAEFIPIRSFQDAFFEENVREAVDHSWYKGHGANHPYKEDTEPNFTQQDGGERYSWIKSPTFQGHPAEVGPLSHLRAMLASGYEPAKKRLNGAVGLLQALLGKDVPPGVLDSTLGRHLARALRCGLMYEELGRSMGLLVANIAKGDTASFNAPNFPKGEIRGFGFLEAPRGMLSHWVAIRGGKIQNYQVIAPTTWNAAPRNADGKQGPYEASLVGTPVADQERPVEVLRTIHSFDPCLACSIHLIDAKNPASHVRVRVSTGPIEG
jgi:hydrogenase large subunit